VFGVRLAPTTAIDRGLKIALRLRRFFSTSAALRVDGRDKVDGDGMFRIG
jgi:hypothetical protein